MRRDVMQQLIVWKNSDHRKPMILKGARQVGKTWLMQEFGRTQYESVAYINMEGNQQMERLFDLDFDIERIVDGLEIFSGIKIEPHKTLIILDEIQEVPRALTALKYFYENQPGYHVLVAGSLLGIAHHRGVSFPVGKVDFMDIYPLSFVEFLQATGEASYADLITATDIDLGIITAFSPKIIDKLRTYYIVGGMPEVINRYMDEGNLLTVRDVQQKILNAYEQDFSKHAPELIVPRIRELWHSMPAQLAKENKKFIFRQVREGARGREYESALLWLEDTGVATRVTRVNNSGLPLSAYENRDIFKLFFLDVGLLGASSKLDPVVVLEGSRIFKEFKGALTEQFVLQELRVKGVRPYYFANDNSRGEIDFIIQVGNSVVPIEVKSETNVRSRSLGAFIDKYSPTQAVTISMGDYEKKAHSVSRVPLYLVNRLTDLTEVEGLFL